MDLLLCIYIKIKQANIGGPISPGTHPQVLLILQQQKSHRTRKQGKEEP
jgi:hypothetical protein